MNYHAVWDMIPATLEALEVKPPWPKYRKRIRASVKRPVRVDHIFPAATSVVVEKLSAYSQNGMTMGNSQTLPLVQVRGLAKSYGRFTAIQDISFAINSGEILGLIGPNGAGKTTLFECLAGLQPSDSGSISFVGPCKGESRSSVLFYVPDDIAPWPQQSVRWGLEFSLDFFGGRRARYDDVVQDLRLESILRTRIGALSKGQRKRFLLAIGLLASQPVLVIDEPFEGLDLRQSREVEATLRNHVGLGRTLFVSIHQIADAARICDRFVLLSNGRLVAEGSLKELTAMARSRLGHLPGEDFEEIFLALT